MKLNFNKNILQILEIIENNGYEAYLIGGCVRDNILNIKSNDYDITTSALPNDIIRIFTNLEYNINNKGIRLGCINIYNKYISVDITTYRKEYNYIKHRYPSNIQFTNNIHEDLKRRDFTINAIAYSPTRGIVDDYNGLEDINNKIIRCINNPYQKFNEDAIRILRCVRFKLLLDFNIELNTKIALDNNLYLINKLNKPILRKELIKIISINRKDILLYLKDIKLLDLLIPEMLITYNYDQRSKWHSYDLFNHINIAFNHTLKSPIDVKLAILFHDLGKPKSCIIDSNNIAHYGGHAHISSTIARTIMKQYEFNKELINNVCTIIDYHDNYLSVDRKVLRKLLSKINNDIGLLALIIDAQIADNYAKNLSLIEVKQQVLFDCKRLTKEMLIDEDFYTLKDLDIEVEDILNLGISKKDINNTLIYLYNQILDKPKNNNKDKLIKLVKIKHNIKATTK